MAKQKKKIFHLEDDKEWVRIVKSALEGYEVHSAGTLPKAVNLFRSKKFDLAILDISLIPEDSQDKQGERFLNALEGKHILPGKRIVILSAYLTGGGVNQDRTRTYFKFFNVKDAVPKQKFDSKEFREIIDEALRSASESDTK